MDELYTVKEVAKIMKVNVHKVYDLIRAGLLPALKLGNIKIRKESLEEFLRKYDGKDLTDLNNICSVMEEDKQYSKAEMLVKLGNYAKILDKNFEICTIKVTEPTTPLILLCATRWDFFIVVAYRI